MQQKRNRIKLLALLLVGVIVIAAGVLMTRDIPPTQHSVEKQLDAKVILEQK